MLNILCDIINMSLINTTDLMDLVIGQLRNRLASVVAVKGGHIVGTIDIL